VVTCFGGNVSGNVSGNVRGNVSGNVRGNVSVNVRGDVSGINWNWGGSGSGKEGVHGAETQNYFLRAGNDGGLVEDGLPDTVVD